MARASLPVDDAQRRPLVLVLILVLRFGFVLFLVLLLILVLRFVFRRVLRVPKQENDQEKEKENENEYEPDQENEKEKEKENDSGVARASSPWTAQSAAGSRGTGFQPVDGAKRRRFAWHGLPAHVSRWRREDPQSPPHLLPSPSPPPPVHGLEAHATQSHGL
ncbi:MAG: hypothetical protein LBK99_19465, partial [Opitutaceae bacterium]|nr:hypothetical protein [Opitutaceae bacterium]